MSWHSWNRKAIFPVNGRRYWHAVGVKENVAVAGTHGKTTVSTMIAVLLSSTAEGCNAFLGGISKNLNSNFIHNPGSEWLVAEADEYDRSFLKLHPYASVITALILTPGYIRDFRRDAAFLQGVRFKKWCRRHPASEKRYFLDTSGLMPRIFTYSLSAGADFYAENIRLMKEGISLILPVRVYDKRHITCSSRFAECRECRCCLCNGIPAGSQR